MYICITLLCIYVDVLVSFNQSAYTINESDGPAQPVITLSIPASFDVRIRVRDVRSSTAISW